MKRCKSSFLGLSCLNRRQLGRIGLVQVRITKALSIGVVGSVMGKVFGPVRPPVSTPDTEIIRGKAS